MREIERTRETQREGVLTLDRVEVYENAVADARLCIQVLFKIYFSL